jgi:hypothetical protein
MELTLSEELMLLALDDDEGDVIFSASMALQYGLAGALIFEMIFRKNIVLDDKTVKLGANNQFEKQIYQEIVELIRSQKKEKDLEYWIWKISNKISDIKENILTRLIEKGILKKEEGKILWLIKYEKYPQQNPIPEIETRMKIRNTVLSNSEPDAKTLALISLINSCQLVDEIFTKHERKSARKRIKEIIKNDELGKSVSHTIAAISVVIGAAVSAAAVNVSINT